MRHAEGNMPRPGRMVRASVGAGVLALGALAVGCSTGSFTVNRVAPTGLGPGEAVTVIPVQRSGDEASAGLEKEAAGCIQDALEEGGWTGRMVPPAEFRQAAFPDLLAVEVPQDKFEWGWLVADATFQQRIAPLGLRYLILVTATEGRGPSRRVEGGWAGGSVFGATVRSERAHFADVTATVLDTRHGHFAGSVSASASGESSFGVALFWLIVPIPYGKASFPGGPACRELGEGVAKFLASQNPPGP